jgi:hypothetical protein
MSSKVDAFLPQNPSHAYAGMRAELTVLSGRLVKRFMGSRYTVHFLCGEAQMRWILSRSSCTFICPFILCT